MPIIHMICCRALARNSKFIGADFTNGIVDRVSFDGSDLRGAIFKNAVLSGTSFTDANLENTDFSDAYLGTHTSNLSALQ